MNAAGELPLDEELKGRVQVKTGQREDNPRRGPIKDIVVKINNGFEIFEARVCREVIALGIPDHPVMFFKQSKMPCKPNLSPSRWTILKISSNTGGQK